MRVSLSVTQRRAGAPLQNIRVTVSADFAVDVFTASVLAVTTSLTPPATMAAIAHYQELTYLGEGAFADSNVEQSRVVITAGVQLQYSDVSTFRKATLALDSNFVAGRYLWAVLPNGPLGTGSTPIVAHSEPYLIR